MIIDRFGDTYDYATVFPPGAFIDDWEQTRPPVVAHAAQMSGAFDFWGTSNYPYAAMTVKKRFMLTGSTWADVEWELESLIQATIKTDESLLWALHRDGAQIYYTYAKCTNITVEERADNPPLGVPVSLEFFCRTGEWYEYLGGGPPPDPEPADGLFTVELLDASNNILTSGDTQAIITNVLSVSWEHRIDEAGRVSFTVPATDSIVVAFLDLAVRFRIKLADTT